MKSFNTLNIFALIFIFLIIKKVNAACGAEGSCHGLGGSELCNDRCKRCTGPSGPYTRGDCCGFAGQVCCCYYS